MSKEQYGSMVHWRQCHSLGAQKCNLMSFSLFMSHLHKYMSEE